jgi:hypothetical protein
MRNAVMSGMALGTVVIEASQTSGAKMQARLALEHGRPVLLPASLVEQHDWAAGYAKRPGTHVFEEPSEVPAIVRTLTALDAPSSPDRARLLGRCRPSPSAARPMRTSCSTRGPGPACVAGASRSRMATRFASHVETLHSFSRLWRPSPTRSTGSSCTTPRRVQAPRRDDQARFELDLSAVLWRFLAGHETCVAAAAEVDGFDRVCTVPSGNAARDERHPLRRIVGEALPVGRLPETLACGLLGDPEHGGDLSPGSPIGSSLRDLVGQA